ncbi:MAG: hypothetical protein ACREO5_02325 [Candidatus Binatia bacterium]
MFEIRYSGVSEIEISASRAELGELRKTLLDLIKSDLLVARLDADRTIDPQPWDSVGKGLKLNRSEGAVRVSISIDSMVIIEGSDQNLDNFSSFLVFDEGENGSHSHFEYHEGKQYVAFDSIPLIISVSD